MENYVSIFKYPPTPHKRYGRVDSTDEITSANFAQIQQLSSQNWIGYVCFSITVQTNRFAMGNLADRYSKVQEQLSKSSHSL
ncbi:MAG: hypothetical protein ACJZ8S_01900 [Paracoccaceae bacterium]